VQLDHASVALRHPTRRRSFELSAAAVAGFRRVLDERGFTEVHTPKIVASATESGANVFGIDYFGEKAYLAQSPQFYKQMLVGVFERVYEVGPVFRAEPHDTTRHLAQYTSLDVEFGFITDHTTVMALVRDVVAGMAGEQIEVPEQIPALHFSEAKALMTEDGEPDLSPAEERWLGEWARAEHGSDFLFVTGYPMRKRPFYTHPDPERPEYSYSFDLLFRGIELSTGGQRLHNHADYVQALEAMRQDPADYESYLRAFRYGMPPHGGFAIGLERWTAGLVGAANLRETTLFPRDLHRLTP
jgi:nondiscriminating aspartyl-tRNA synthetase